jgi:dTDP-4-amino-4,6-dideoxygalactose transaminase
MTDQLAIDGGTPVKSDAWPTWPVWGEAEERNLLEVLHSGVWNDRGEGKVAAFEAAFAEYQHAKRGIAVTGGTAALEMGLRALGVKPGDEVITTSYTFSATPAAIFKVGAVPVPADIDPGTMSLDPSDVEARITPKTVALMPVHIGGCPADMTAMLDIAKRHGLAVIEDACQAWGSEWERTRVGAIGDVGAFSFQATKNINAGEGGVAVSNDADLADRIWSLHNSGRVREGSRNVQSYMGYNYRMTEFQAAVLLAQLGRLPEHTVLRERNGALLDELLGAIPGITPRARDPRVTRNGYHLYMFNYQAEAFGGASRTKFLDALRAEGIPCSPGYPPLYTAEGFRRAWGEQSGALEPWSQGDDLPTLEPRPACEKACQETVWFYQWQLLADEQVMQDVATAIERIRVAWG